MKGENLLQASSPVNGQNEACKVENDKREVGKRGGGGGKGRFHDAFCL